MSEVEGSGIGARLRAARQRRSLSRDELAVRSGISSSAIAQIESGRRRNVRPGTLSALASALGLTVDYLLGRGPAQEMCEHRAYMYDDDDVFLETIGALLRDGSEAGDSLLFLATAPKIEALRDHLGQDARSIEFLESKTWLTTPGDALVALTELASRELERGAAWVRIVGEPIWELTDDADVDRWMRFEAMINIAFASWPMTMICPYDRRTIDPAIIARARETHPAVVDELGGADDARGADPSGFAREP